jgi:DNA-binding PadR family transcriptional regulator
MSDESLKPQWFHILLSLADGPRHGTAVMEEVLERTEGTVRLWPGMLYGSLSDLSDLGLIEETEAPSDAPTEGGRRRFYAVTEAGRAAVSREASRLATYVAVARSKRLLDEVGPA